MKSYLSGLVLILLAASGCGTGVSGGETQGRSQTAGPVDLTALCGGLVVVIHNQITNQKLFYDTTRNEVSPVSDGVHSFLDGACEITVEGGEIVSP